jgi:hypothetical protein
MKLTLSLAIAGIAYLAYLTVTLAELGYVWTLS